MFWIVIISAATLLGGLAGFSSGGIPAALVYSIIGASLAVGVRDLSRHRHAIIAVSVVVFASVLHFAGLQTALLATILAFPIQLAVAEFVNRQSPFAPLAMATTFGVWWEGYQHFGSMAALTAALLTLLTLVAAHDRFLQKQHAVRHNFPLIGWFRYGFELVGDELRQYWFMSDTEETPYNRVTRKWVYRSAKGLNNGLGFGTQRRYREVGEIHMLPSMFPLPDTERVGNRLRPLIVGPNRTKPYLCPSPINISGMSWGALSEEAVRALSSGAKLANVHMSTGEGGLTPFHLEGVVSNPGQKTLGYRLRQLLWGASLGLAAKPAIPQRTVIGGGRIVCQIGPAKFGFRKPTTRRVAEQMMRGIYSLAGHAPDDPIVMIDMDKVRRVAANDQIVMFEVKLAQGAKPGQGGKLPKEKITAQLAEWRGIPMGVDCYSPNAWDEFHDVPSLFRFLTMLQRETGKPVGIKIVLGNDDAVREIAQHMKETGEAPDFITVDGGEGGTGAAPVSLADRMGLPILHAIPKVDNVLREYGVRNKTLLVASGQIAKGDDVAIAIAMGADMVNIARGNLLAQGCIMALRCHTNTCPTGITTQDPRLRRGLDPMDKYVKVANYNRTLLRELLMFMKSCGVRHPWDLTRAHLSVVIRPMVEERMDVLHPYPDNSGGARDLPMGDIPADDANSFDVLGPKIIAIKAI